MSASEVVDNKKPVEPVVVKEKPVVVAEKPVAIAEKPVVAAEKPVIAAEKPVERDLSSMFNSETLSDVDVLNPATNITYK